MKIIRKLNIFLTITFIPITVMPKNFYVNNYNVVTTVPAELNLRQLKARKCNIEEFIVYGYMPVMIWQDAV